MRCVKERSSYYTESEQKEVGRGNRNELLRIKDITEIEILELNLLPTIRKNTSILCVEKYNLGVISLGHESSNS